MEPIATKQKKSICKLMIVVLICGLSHANPALGESGKTACNSPKGELEIDKTVDCGGTETVGIGKEYTGKTKNLEDKDCYCGSKVDDTIDSGTGIKWTIDGSAETTATFSKNAPGNIATISVSLEIDDKATDPTTTDDGGFTPVDNITINAVIPNADTPSDNNKSCPFQTYGFWKEVSDKFAYSGCSVDFSGLSVKESVCYEKSNTCILFRAPLSFGGPTATIGSDGTTPGYVDKLKYCSADSLGDTDCTRTTACSWQIKGTGGSWMGFFTRTISVNFDSQGQISVTHSEKF